MTYGEYRRTAQRLNVLRGFTGNEPQSLTTSAAPKLNEAIKSGMLISLDVNNQWVKGVPAGKTPYFAYHDQSDTDVISSGLLTGLSCAGVFELETAYFDNGQAYVTDSPLKADTVTPGQVTLATLNGGADIVGFATRGGRQNTSNLGQFNNSEGGTLAGPNYSLTLRTQFQPVHS